MDSLCLGVLRHELADFGATVGQMITRRWRINFQGYQRDTCDVH